MAVFICQGCGAEHSSWEGKCPKCGTSETIRLAPNTDRMVDRVVKGKFKVVRKLGQGGMGAVYLAEQVGIGHRVALKFLKAEFSTDAEIARRFLNEAKSYARVAHPNAVALHDFGQDEEGNLFIAMEYCEGVDLKKVIAEQGKMTMIEAIEVVLQVADVLANAHEKGVVHRDLKPENIMIRRGIRGVHAKVLDFGIARLMDAGTKLTVAGAIAGTPRYMSPEQVEGKEVDHRADIYSLGIVLFECLTGRQPFDGSTIAEILRKQAVEPMPHLVEFAPELDYPDLDKVIQKACAKRRDERWPDMLSFASALSQAIPTQAHLGLTPLQKSSVSLNAVSMATPRPTQVTSTSGVAVPGSAIDQESTAQTLLKTGEASAVQRAAPTQVGPGGGTATQVGGESLPPVAPKSKAPIAIASLVVIALAGGGLYLALREPAETKGTATTGVANKPPPPPEVADAAVIAVVNNPQVDVGAGAGNGTNGTAASAEALKLLREEANRNRLADGKTALEVANLDTAESYFKSVEAETATFSEAQELLKRIGTIREKLAQAKTLKSSGACDRALPLYQDVLKLNGKVKDALDGVSACRQAAVAPTME